MELFCHLTGQPFINLVDSLASLSYEASKTFPKWFNDGVTWSPDYSSLASLSYEASKTLS